MSGGIADGPLEIPFAGNGVELLGQSLHLNDGGSKIAHGFLIGISFFVIVQGILPAISNPGFSNEHQGVIFPITLHKGFQVEVIPGHDLFLEQLGDGFFVFGLGRRENRDPEQER